MEVNGLFNSRILLALPGVQVCRPECTHLGTQPIRTSRLKSNQKKISARPTGLLSTVSI
jgi:hypothetical protein